MCVIGWWWLWDGSQVQAWSVWTAVLVQWMMGNAVLEWSVTVCVVWKSMWWVSDLWWLMNRSSWPGFVTTSLYWAAIQKKIRQRTENTSLRLRFNIFNNILISKSNPYLPNWVFQLAHFCIVYRLQIYFKLSDLQLFLTHCFLLKRLYCITLLSSRLWKTLCWRNKTWKSIRPRPGQSWPDG